MKKIVLVALLILPIIATVVLFSVKWRAATEMVVSRYSTGIPVFADRDYNTLLPTASMDGFVLIALPRHYGRMVEIEVDADSYQVHRMLGFRNDNRMFEDWQKTNIPIMVDGYTTDHTEVVKKTFNSRRLSLIPGGPISSSPILIDVDKDVKVDVWSWDYLYEKLLPEGLNHRSIRTWVLIGALLIYYFLLGLRSIKN